MAISVSDRLSNPGKWFVFLLHCSLDSRRYFKTSSKAPEENLNHSFAKIIEQNIWPPEAIFVSDWLCFKISYASDSDPTSCSPPKFDVWPYVLENICNTKSCQMNSWYIDSNFVLRYTKETIIIHLTYS
jgi:hypothetical protein